MLARHTGRVTLRILLISRWYPSHDEPRRGLFAADLATALASLGNEVVVASFEELEAGDDEARAAAGARFTEALERPDALARPRSWGASGVPVARLPLLLEPGRRQPVERVDDHVVPLLPFGAALADRWPFDIVHVQSGLPDGLAAARLAEQVGLPILVTEHSSTLPDQLADPEAVAAYREFLRPERRISAVSRHLARAMAGRLGVASSAIAVLPNPVAVDRFVPGSEAERDPDELLYVGSRRTIKGIEGLLRAFRDVRADRPRLRLRLVGDPGSAVEETAWRELCGELRIEDAVTFEEPLDRDGVAAALRRATALVHPSRRETFGTVAAEALAVGTPVATLPSGGVDEFIGHGGTHGEIADGMEHAQLAAAISRLLARRASYDPTVLRRHVESTAGSPVVAARTVALYEELLGGRRRAAASDGGAGDPGGGGRFALPLVVGLDREAVAAAVGALPAELAAGLTVVTQVGGGELPAVGRWVEADPEAVHRERRLAIGRPLARAGGEPWWRVVARAPLIVLRRVLLDRRRAALASESIAGAIAGAGEAMAATAKDGDLVVVPLAAADVVASEGALAQGARIAPGSLRWLVDRWDAAGRP